MAAYSAALEGHRIAYSGKATPGSTAAVVLAYLAADPFKRIPSEQTRKTHRGILERFAVKHGEKPFELFDRKAVEIILERMEGTPGAARNLRNVLRRMCRWAIKERLIRTDPTEGVKVAMPKSEGWHTMTDEERFQFEAAYPIGTKARAVYAVLYFTALRVTDAARLGPQHLRGDEIVIRQHKTGDEVKQPAHPEMMWLSRRLDRRPPSPF